MTSAPTEIHTILEMISDALPQTKRIFSEATDNLRRSSLFLLPSVPLTSGLSLFQRSQREFRNHELERGTIP
jgi:hypothetical protein